MIPAEQETTISYDYDRKVVRIYTTREGVFNNIKKRLGSSWMEEMSAKRDHGWYLIIPVNLCRQAYAITKCIG